MPNPTALSESLALRAYAEKTPTSAQLYQRARDTFPSGVTHDSRYMSPHPVFIARAQGPRKWDVDGNEYVDYFGGHGALLLGHNHPVVVDAVQKQLSRGVHYGASHELELEWAELIKKFVPSAERVRFTVSGTEATHLGLRVARAYTGKRMFVRFASHFHGWHDHVAFGRGAAETAPAGIPPGIVESAIVCPPGDAATLKTLFAERDDIAAVILEPTGSTFGKAPLPPGFLADLRQLTEQHGIVLIFDEVITGFRCSLGGAQAFYQVTPDLTTLAKILGGGYPAAALVGRADVLGVMEHRGGPPGLTGPLVPHQGTYNAGPISAAAGLATLRYLESSDTIERANQAAATLRREMNAVISKLGCGWCVYGGFSGFHIFTNPNREAIGPDEINSGKVSPWTLKAMPMELMHKIRAGMLAGGADLISWPGGIVSGVHQGGDVDQTLTAFEKTLRMLADEGALS